MSQNATIWTSNEIRDKECSETNLKRTPIRRNVLEVIISLLTMVYLFLDISLDIDSPLLQINRFVRDSNGESVCLPIKAGIRLES